MRSTVTIIAAAVLGLAASLPVTLEVAHADALTNRPDILPVSALKPKMKGYGLTVFEGTKPERFEVEIIDVLDNFRPRQDLILVKTKHPRLEVAKVVAGMSGSPVYIDGKMIGAYAYGWTFGKEPVAGVTPIRNMLDDLVRPLPPSIHGFPLQPLPAATASRPAKTARAMPPASSRGAFVGAPQEYDVRTHSKQLAQSRDNALSTGSAPLAPVSTPVLVGGMTPGAIAAMRDVLSPLGLEPMQAGGGGATEADAPKRYVDGGAIGVQMVRGDMSAMGIGTVTRVEGDRLVAFGHPMMNVGVTAMPTAIGRILWFMATQMRSFKIGTAVRPVGTLVNDRTASIVVSQDLQPPIVPVSLQLAGEPGAAFTKWNFEVAHDKFMTPAFLGVALGSALEAAAAERRDVTWTATGKLKVAGGPEVTILDYGASETGTPQVPEMMRSNLVRGAGAILNNPWQPVLIESVDFDIDLVFGQDLLRLRGAEILNPELDPGEAARIRLTLETFDGPQQTRIISVPVPKRFAGQTLNLEIAPGYTVERERAAPESLDELIANMEDPVYPPKSIVVSFDSGSGGVAYRGRVAKNLPPGALDSLTTVHSSISPSQFETEVRHVIKSPQFLVGRDSVSVTVRPALR